MKKLLFCFFAVALFLCLAGCEYLMSPQERSGYNPKPFNSQADWEIQGAATNYYSN